MLRYRTTEQSNAAPRVKYPHNLAAKKAPEITKPAEISSVSKQSRQTTKGVGQKETKP